MSLKIALAVIKKDGKILSISRKDNHKDFGLIGGKVDEGETFIQAVIREVKEEVGLDGFFPQLIDQRVYRGNLVSCFVFTEVRGWDKLKLGNTPEGFISFKSEEELKQNFHSYSDYNSDIFALNKFL